MSFTCSLMGHRFGDTEVEREREEDGSEVITTVREIRTCSRCGTRRVVSESTEVTTVETPSDIVGEDLNEGAGATAASEGAGQPDTEPSAEPEPETETEPDPVPESPAGDPPSGPGAGVGAEGAHPAEDDGIILGDDNDEESGRAPGEWPEENESEPEVERVTESPESGPERVEATSEVVTVPEGTFECPECEFSTPVEDSSLRAGDFCPECRTATLEHHRE